MAELRPSDGGAYESFGTSVAIDGDVVVVGSPGHSGVVGFGGAAYVYERTATGWRTYETHKLDVPDPPWYPHPFAPVALTEDRILCGGDAVFVFQSDAAGWAGAVETMRLECPDGPGANGFGRSLALWGHRALVGSEFFSSSSPGTGKAFLYGLSIGSDVEQLTLTAGGSQTLVLTAGASQARRYSLLLGSASGTHAGIDLGSVSLPLTADDYFAYTLLNPGCPPILGTPGLLDAFGGGQATIALPPRPSPAWAGIELHHAYLVLHPSGPVAIPFASDPVRLTLVP